MVVLGQLDVAPCMSSQRGWVFLATGITEGDHEREHEEQDMHSAWFTGGEIESVIGERIITHAHTMAARALLRLAETRGKGLLGPPAPRSRRPLPEWSTAPRPPRSQRVCGSTR